MRTPWWRSTIDRVGPFPVELVCFAVLLVDLIALALIITALIWASDRIEDRLWPGGTEWVDL